LCLARLRNDPGSRSPRSRACRHANKCEEYTPSRRSIAPSAPGAHASASRSMRSLSSVVNRRRFGLSRTSRSFALRACTCAVPLLGLVSNWSHHFPLPACIRFRGTLVPSHLDTGGSARLRRATRQAQQVEQRQREAPRGGSKSQRRRRSGSDHPRRFADTVDYPLAEDDALDLPDLSTPAQALDLLARHLTLMVL
jgi:hypothetical protein